MIHHSSAWLLPVHWLLRNSVARSHAQPKLCKFLEKDVCAQGMSGRWRYVEGVRTQAARVRTFSYSCLCSCFSCSCSAKTQLVLGKFLSLHKECLAGVGMLRELAPRLRGWGPFQAISMMLGQRQSCRMSSYVHEENQVLSPSRKAWLGQGMSSRWRQGGS